ncbi:MAG: pinensin family lanthipeptide [Bacteroidota bacterium]
MKSGKIKLEKLKLKSFVTDNEELNKQTIAGGVLHQNPSVTDCGSVFCPTNVVLYCPSMLHCPDDC